MSDNDEKKCGCGCECEGHDHTEENEDLYITLEFEDGTEVECLVMDTLTIDGKEYMALLPEGQEEYYIYGYKELEDGIEVINIDDEKEFEKVVQEFQAHFDALGEEEDEEEE
jgi:hypothetical protein